MSFDATPQPQRPANLSPHALACLEALSEHHLGSKVSLGGAFGLLHYLDYRPTHDLDAWWHPQATGEDRRRVLAAITEALSPSGQVRTRAWGETVSVELLQEGRAVFSFQIADRSAQLQPPDFLPWIDVLVDGLDDLLASKMVALVERGAPRDLRDVYTACQSGLVTPSTCWALWRRRQELAGSDADRFRARLAIETHLARIAQHRPLDRISHPAQRAAACRLRSWFAQEFLNAP